jgi:hypothetical protein
MPVFALIHPDSRPQTKGFRLNNGQFEEIGFTFSRLYDWSWLRNSDLNSLSENLLELETQPDRMIVRGSPVSGTKEGRRINRRMNGQGANICNNPCQWLCIDIDNLDLPPHYIDFNSHAFDIAQYATQDRVPPNGVAGAVAIGVFR